MLADYNAVLYFHERSNGLLGAGNKDAAFRSFFQNVKLVDLGFSGPSFTWVHGLSSDTFAGARLDRALGNMEWRTSFSNTCVLHLPRFHSDHSPILVKSKASPLNGRSNSFRFQAAWYSHPNFAEWLASFCDTCDSTISDKTKSFTEKVKIWSRDVFGDINKKKKRLQARLASI